MMKWFMNEESGQGMVEYGLILVLVALGAIVALTSLGTGISEKFGAIQEEFGKAKRD